MSQVLSPQTDPGVPIVYAGFGALMLTTCISYLSHTQVRIRKIGQTIHISALVPFSFEENSVVYIG